MQQNRNNRNDILQNPQTKFKVESQNSTEQEEITKIINNSSKPREKALQLLQYQPHTVCHTILTLINSYPTCCMHIASIIQCLFSIHYEPKKKRFIDESTERNW